MQVLITEQIVEAIDRLWWSEDLLLLQYLEVLIHQQIEEVLQLQLEILVALRQLEIQVQEEVQLQILHREEVLLFLLTEVVVIRLLEEVHQQQQGHLLPQVHLPEVVQVDHQAEVALEVLQLLLEVEGNSTDLYSFKHNKYSYEKNYNNNDLIRCINYVLCSIFGVSRFRCFIFSK